MDDIPLSVLFSLLGVMILLSAFFSSAETSMMALNRYRLRHQLRNRHRAARRVSRLLERPDQLLGLILLGNNLVNIIAATIATLIGLRLLGDLGVALAPPILVVIFLIFAEVLPKTLAALYPERIAFPASLILQPLMKLLYPAVYVVNLVTNGLLAWFRVDLERTDRYALSRDELRTIVLESSHIGSEDPRRKMLLAILELESIRVQDVMVPRSEVVAVDILESPQIIMRQISASKNGRIPVYEGNMDQTIGILHLRRLPRILTQGQSLDTEKLREILAEPHFVPESTLLYHQLQCFQKSHSHLGMVVDEYGTVQGIVTLEDILEEIVGEFTTGLQDYSVDIQDEEDGTWLMDGMVTLREIKRQLHWDIPSTGQKTLNGLIVQKLGHIPKAETSLVLKGGYTAEIVQVGNNAVKRVRIMPPDKSAQSPHEDTHPDGADATGEPPGHEEERSRSVRRTDAKGPRRKTP